MFQSAPGIDDGRSDVEVAGQAREAGFNPLPASMPGEASSTGTSSSKARFNPLPASMPGEAADGTPGWLPRYVSIRSRHRCREKRGSRNNKAGYQLFQSAPGID